MKSKRTLKSKLVQWAYLKLNKKSGLMSETGLKVRLDECREINSKDYILPKCTSKMDIDKYMFENIECFKILPKTKKTDKHILYLHGGAYTNGPVGLHFKLLEKISDKSGCEITIPMYPKLPQYTYKECYLVVVNLYLELIKQYGNENIILMGDSAGGGLCAGLCCFFKENNIVMPSKLILISPWVDISMCNELAYEKEADDIMLSVYGLKEIGKLWANDLDVKNPILSPLYGDLIDFPKTLMFCGENEILYYDINDFHNKLLESNVSSTLIIENGLGHVYCIYPFKDCKLSINKIIEEIC